MSLAIIAGADLLSSGVLLSWHAKQQECMLLKLTTYVQPLYGYMHGSNKQSRSLPSSAPLAVRITPNESLSGAANSTWTLTKNFTLAMYLANETMVR